MSSSRFRALIPFSLLALVLTATPGYSTTTTFSDLVSWQSVATILQTINFTGTTPGSYSNGLNIGGIEFSGIYQFGGIGGVLDTSLMSWQNFGTGNAFYINVSGNSMPVIHIVLPAPVTAVSMNLFSANPNALAFTVTLAGASFTVPTFTTPTPAFFGVTSDTPFTTVDLSLANWSTNAGAYQFVDNFSTAQADAPEAVTSLLIGSGLLWIGVMRRRARTNSQSRRSQPKIAHAT